MRNRWFFVLALNCSLALADIKEVRWTYQEDTQSDFSHILSKVNEKSGLNLKPEDFTLLESRPLAGSHFVMYNQRAGGFPVRGQMIRVWTKPDTQEVIQVEAHVDETLPEVTIRRWGPKVTLDATTTVKLAKKAVQQLAEDTEVKGIQWKDEWINQELIRNVTVKNRRGKHEVWISLQDKKVVKASYQPFPKGDQHSMNVPALVYPIWEEYENVPANLNNRIQNELRYLHVRVREGGENPYQALKDEMRYLENYFDPIKGLTEEGRKLGFWSMSYVKNRAQEIYNKLPLVPNSFKTGAILEGKYATVNLHPSVQNLEGIDFVMKRSSQFRPNWVVINQETEMMEMVPEAGFLGRPMVSLQDAYQRPNQRLLDHSVVSYINDGFDEVQVYWAITQLFDSLRPMGFTDPELSSRPFHAYLYDTDISMKDNAYYTDDTINFTTYSSKSHNMARDNSTIWHELGHGVMDRLMGEHLVLADTGGLSEGIADFVADLVIQEVMKGKDFEGSKELRILNRTGFYLTNESHDDGEAYGGTLHDILEKAMARKGLEGLRQVTDLTLEAMRFTRNHPGLTATDWFSHLLFADERGNGLLRKPGELRAFILEALEGRNFRLEGGAVAEFRLVNGQNEVDSNGLGSRSQPIWVKMKQSEIKEFPLRVQLKSTEAYEFKYPVTIKVQLRHGPIQGAIKWKNESDKPLEYVLRSEKEMAYLPLAIHGECDEVNRPDGSCVDYAYVQVWNHGEKKQPQAKKRFYLRVVPGGNSPRK